MPELKKLNPRVLAAKGVETDIDLCYVLPFKYQNYSFQGSLSPVFVGKCVAISGTLVSVRASSKNFKSVITGKLQTGTDGTSMNFTYIGQKQMQYELEPLYGKDIIVCGKLKFDPQFGYSMLNPDEIRTAEMGFAWRTVYHRFRHGKESIAQSTLAENILSKQMTSDITETMPGWLLEETGLKGRREALMDMTCPPSQAGLMGAMQRVIFEDMLYFACCMEVEKRKLSPGSQYNLKSKKSAEEAILSLPYALTGDQRRVFDTLSEKMKNGRRLSYLVQGDVGCGKSIVCFLLMLCMADSGYQSVIMAPTFILAEQHYKELSALGEKFGYKTAFLSGLLKKSELRKIEQGIADGEYQMVVGTHAAISESVKFQNLALILIDEEQKFGVRQRKLLREKASNGVHSVSFTATPIPRTNAMCLYGEMNVLSIKDKPASRKEVKTAISRREDVTMNFVKKKIAEGEQAYVICSLIDTENETPVKTVKEVSEMYENALGVPVGVVTGKQGKAETAEIIESFRKGDIKILVGTTVLEVGVSVPTANVIVIEDAWAFGLSQLHQLRGRVGRGDRQGYCILQTDRESEGLDVLARTTDGFEVAEADMRLRGKGNLLGEEQSGSNRYMDQITQFPVMYSHAVKAAERMVDSGEADILIEETERRNESIYFDFKKVKVFDSSGFQWPLWASRS